jgi:type IV pilus assembly protein PilN
VILINLLPHRETARKRRREEFNASLGVAALVGALLSGLNYLWFQSQIAAQQQKNQTLQTANNQFDSQIKDVAGIETEIAALLARQRAVEDLQADRNLPVLLLADLAKQIPNGVYVTSLQQDNLNVTLKGVAQSNERVSEFLKNLGSLSEFFSHPELDEILTVMVNVSAKEQRRAASFTIRVRLIRAREIVKINAPIAPANVQKVE